MNIILYSIPFFILAMILEFYYTRMKHLPLYRLNDTLSNLGAGIFQQTLGFIPTALTLACYPWLYEHAPLPFFKNQTGILSFVTCWVLVDFIYYWAHRMYHRTGLGWTGHIVHHQSEEYNLSVALRQSWLQGLHGVPFGALPALLGFEASVSIPCMAVNTVYQFWIHTQVIRKCPRWFEAVFNTPSHHRVHHGRNTQYIDKNYAGSLIVWDKIFGTFEPEGETVIYGITQATQTWNPLTAQFGPWVNLFKKGRGKGVWLNMRYNIHPPGWNERDGDRLPPLIPRDKFDPKVPSRHNKLAVGSFLLTLVLMLIFMFKGAAMPTVTKVAFVSAIISLLCMTGYWQDQDGKDSSPT